MKTILLFSFFMASNEVPGASHYRAEPESIPVASRFAMRDLYWRCDAGECVAGKSASRPAIVCAALAKHVGRLKSFSTSGIMFDAPALQRCNASAR